MFGYLRPESSELRVREFELYRSVYCGLCKSMGKDYGLLTRLTLSYDCTLLAMFAVSLRSECSHVRDGRCVFNPMKKCRFCSSEGEGFRFAGAVSVIMTYYKLQDTISDSGFFKRTAARAGRLFVKGSYKRAEKAYPDIAAAVSDMIASQQQAENDHSGIDASSDPTATLLSKLCISLSEDEGQRMVLSRFGYFLGRWIYLMDAADDLEKDIKHNNFNPFRKYFEGDLSSAMEYCNSVLNMTVSQLVLAYDLLELDSYKEILDNVMYYGLSFQQKHCLFSKNNKKKCSKKEKDHYNYLSKGEKRS